MDKSIVSEYSDRFVTVSKTTEILPNVFVFPKIISSHPQPAGNKQLYLRKDGKLIHDDFCHEVVMAIKDKDEPVIFTGCSHNGLLNMWIPLKGNLKGCR